MQRRPDGSYLFSPTDLVNFLGCYHAIVLDLRSFSEQLEADDPSETDILLQRKGLAHEASYLRTLRDQGKTVAEISTNLPAAERVRRTLDALRAGTDVVYQAALLEGQWGGFADFLIKTQRPSDLGDFSYEVIDTKLAKSPDAKHVVQLCVYSDLLATIQGVMSLQTHLVLGDGGRVSFRVEDFAYYVRHARRRFELFANSPPANSYPDPCSHCLYCRWHARCSAQWEQDDHLSLVANIQHSQRIKLEDAGVNTVAGLASSPPDKHIPSLNTHVFQRLRSQAALQAYKRRTGENKVEVIDCELGRGFYRLPKPDPDDLFFDMEGDPNHPSGLEYLFGVLFFEEGKPRYRSFWAHDHGEERITFGKFMEFLHVQLTAHPNAHIYHYNHYEPTALKRLACRYALAEHQLDHLLRTMKFVDLYKVVREAIRVSEPAYSIKNLETFYMGEKRSGAVATAGDSMVVYNKWRETRDETHLREIASYNELDCLSTAKLRDWLLTLRPADLPWFAGPAAPTDAENAAEKKAKRQEREERYAEFQARLQEAATHGETDYRFRLSDLLGFHDREARPQWWEFFDRQDRFEDELIDDPECLAGLTLEGQPQPVKKSLLHTYRFPAQETKRRAGDQVSDVATLASAGTIEEVDEEKMTVSIKRAAKNGPLPKNLSIGPSGPINCDVLREALFRVAVDVLAERGSYRVLQDILRKELPRIRGRRQGEPIAPGGDLLRASTDAVANLDQSYLFIQGPPGAGKTYTCSHVIIELIRQGKKVGVAANSHKAIHNLLDKIEDMAEKRGIAFDGVKKSSGDDNLYEGRFIHSEDKKENISLDAQLLAGTAWLFADARFDHHLDYLFIDEAGQVALANVIAMGTAARNIVLVGDQMQLGQPVQGVHPGDAGLSVLEFLLGGQATVSPERGIFLNHTYRLHPAICRFISDAFYDGRLAPHPDNTRRQLVFKSPIDGIEPQGIHFLPVTHAGCSQKSEDEAKVINQYYQKLLGQQFEDGKGGCRSIKPDDMLVVSPYNVQVNHLKSVLPEGAKVGTVDKFQGQEAPIVLVSMATSSAEDMPRNIEFLFSANRLNVALSRAQCLAIVVASPKLLETPCRSIEQLRLVNKFCQLVAYANGESWRS
jgi:uncharacterized protein